MFDPPALSKQSLSPIPQGYQPIAGDKRSVITGYQYPTHASRRDASRRFACISSGCDFCTFNHPVVFAALDHRLIAEMPSAYTFARD
jgi:hypothetical protein